MSYKVKKPLSMEERMGWVFYLRTPPRKADTMKVQRKMLIDYANANGLGIVGEYADAANADRPSLRSEFSKMLKKIESGEVKKIICMTKSHLSQNAYESSLIDMYLHSHKLEAIRYVGNVSKTSKRVNGNQ